MISDRVAIFGAPGILMIDKDPGFIGGTFQEFHSARNIISQKEIPGNHQSLGAIAGRRRLFRTIIDHVVVVSGPNNLTNKEWKEFEAMPAMRLNSQGRQYGGFTPGRKGFGRTPKLPIGVAESHFF